MDLRLPPGYRAEKLLGEGGMGRVVQAWDERRKRRVAIKILHHSLLDDPQWARRLEQEARLAARVTHPNVVKVLETGTLEESTWIAFALIEGRDLRHILENRGPWEWPRAASIAAAVADGLGALHGAGILHRDVKPENVLIARAGPVVADLGIARDITGGQRHTRTGLIVGTPAYLAPELIGEGDGITTAVDVYGLGILLHEMIAGSPPFVGEVPEVLRAHLTAVPPDLRERRPEVPAALAGLVRRCLEKEARARPAAAEVAGELRALIEAAPERVVTSVTTAGAGRARAGGLAAALAVAVALVVAAAARRPVGPPPVSASATASAAPTPPTTPSILLPVPSPELVTFLPALFEKETSVKAMENLRRISGLDIAETKRASARSWADWIRIYQYLLDGGPPPAFAPGIEELLGRVDLK